MKKWLKKQAARALRAILPPEPPRLAAPQLSPDRVADILRYSDPEWQDYRERVHETHEARQLAGAGPWLPQADRAQLDRPGKFRESGPFANNSWTADIELALQNVEWRREVNMARLEFSRWGIQRIIEICRLYYIKHPWIRRGVNLKAAYVFGQGVELSSPDPDANECLKSFRERNKSVLGQVGLCAQQRSKSTDGNKFTALFADKEGRGEVNVRIIDATEIMDIVTNPDDSKEEWYFRRVWTQRNFDPQSGITSTGTAECWYPALGYEPDFELQQINNIDVDWNMRIHHRKCGGIDGWLFGCPPIFPALDDSREGRKFLNNWASVWAALRQIALTVTTKGGQQALEGIKGQWQTTVGPTSNLLDQNPPSVAGSMFGSGPGTVLSAFKTQGSGGDPKEICELRNMVACVLEIPPTWLGDMETSNLSTAQTLDRPTELGFLLEQEEWQEDLSIFGAYQLKIAAAASGSKLKEALDMRKVTTIRVTEARRVMVDCHWVYREAKKKKPDVIEVLVNFPSIREGDQPARVAAIVAAMTLGNKGGQIIGIDEKVGVRELYDALGMPNGDEHAEEQYPDGEYNADRTKEILPAPIGKTPLAPGGSTQAPPDQVAGDDGRAPEPPMPKSESAVSSAQMHLRRQGQHGTPRPTTGTIQRVLEALKAWEAENGGSRPNGHA